MGSISKYINTDFLNTTTYLKEIIDTLEAISSVAERCTVCNEQNVVPEHAPCCSAACARDAYAISCQLETALQEQDTDSQTLIHSQGTVAINAMNVMLAILLQSSNILIQKRIRRLLLVLSKNSRQIPSSLFLERGAFRRSGEQYQGGFGLVFKATYRDVEVAAKVIHEINLADAVEHVYPGIDVYRMREWLFCYEALVWKTLKHERLISLLGIARTELDDFMVSPWHKEGSALNFLKKIAKNDTNGLWGDAHQGLIYRWLLQIIEGLKHLHSQGISHGDLQPGNVIVVNPRPNDPDNGELNVVLTDFGLSVLHEANSRQQGSLRAGTFEAPEQIDPQRFGVTSTTGRPTEKSDIFTFAALCYELYTTKKPYTGRGFSGYRLQTAVVDLVPLDRELVVEVQGDHIPVRIPDQLWEIIERCWTAPEERPSLDWIEDKLKAAMQ